MMRFACCSPPLLLGMFFLLLSSICFCLINAESTTESNAVVWKQWKMIHSWRTAEGQQIQVDRGHIDLTSSSSDNDDLELNITNIDLTPELRESIHQSATTTSSTRPSLYQVQLIHESQKVMASIPICHVIRANFRDEISLMLDSRGNLLSMTLTPLISPLAPTTCDAAFPERKETLSFTSRGALEWTVPAMTIPLVLPQTKPPLGLKFFPRKMGNAKVPGMDDDANGGNNGKPQSFLLKYWYIILPLFIMGIMGPGEEQPQQQQQGGATPAATAIPAQPQAAPIPAAGGGQQQASARRRGKRG